VCLWAGNQQSPDNGDWEKQEEADFHRIVAWDKLAEFCDQYLRKGRMVHVEGRLQTRTYTGQDGIEKYTTEIVAEELMILDKMPDEVKESLGIKDASKGAQMQQV
jgi:single-strand DNA-binding protein